MSGDTLLALLDWLGPIHVMALVRADPPLVDFIQQRLGSVYRMCVDKIYYYAVECSSTAVVSPEQWAHLMAPRNVNDFVMGGGEYLRRALTFDFTRTPMRAEFTGRVSWSNFNVNHPNAFFRVISPARMHTDERYVYGQWDSRSMREEKPSLLSKTQIFQIHRNYLSPRALFIAHPASVLHNTSIIDAHHHSFREYYPVINTYAGLHPEHCIFIDSALPHPPYYDDDQRDKWTEAWADVVRALRELQHPNVCIT